MPSSLNLHCKEQNLRNRLNGFLINSLILLYCHDLFYRFISCFYWASLAGFQAGCKVIEASYRIMCSNARIHLSEMRLINDLFWIHENNSIFQTNVFWIPKNVLLTQTNLSVIQTNLSVIQTNVPVFQTNHLVRHTNIF